MNGSVPAPAQADLFLIDADLAAADPLPALLRTRPKTDGEGHRL
jgi:hypothetical protein